MVPVRWRARAMARLSKIRGQTREAGRRLAPHLGVERASLRIVVVLVLVVVVDPRGRSARFEDEHDDEDEGREEPRGPGSDSPAERVLTRGLVALH